MESGPVIETPLSGAQCIHDMLLQSWGGKIRVFPAVPSQCGLTVNNNEENKAVNYDIALQNGSYRVRVIANAESDLSAEPFEDSKNYRR